MAVARYNCGLLLVFACYFHLPISVVGVKSWNDRCFTKRVDVIFDAWDRVWVPFDWVDELFIVGEEAENPPFFKTRTIAAAHLICHGSTTLWDCIFLNSMQRNLHLAWKVWKTANLVGFEFGSSATICFAMLIWPRCSSHIKENCFSISMNLLQYSEHPSEILTFLCQLLTGRYKYFDSTIWCHIICASRVFVDL